MRVCECNYNSKRRFFFLSFARSRSNTPGFAKYLYKYILVLLTAIIIIIMMIGTLAGRVVLAIPLLRTTGLNSSSSLNVLIFVCVYVCVHDTYTFIHKTTFIIHRNYDDDNAVVVEAVVVKNVVYGNRGGQSTYRVVGGLAADNINFTNRYIITILFRNT